MADFISTIKKLKVESEIKCCVVNIKIDDAAFLLKEFNHSNRMLNKSLEEYYASEMLRGKWELNGEPLIFGINDSGRISLLTGQHRLNALIKATIVYRCDKNAKTKYPNARLELETVIIYGVNSEVADSIDKGKTRSHSDVLYRNEWINSLIGETFKKTPASRNKFCRTLATAARVVWLRAGGATVSSAPKFVISEMLEFIKDKHEKLIDFTNEILLLSSQNVQAIKMPMPYCIGLSYVASLNEDGVVDEEAYATIINFINNLVNVEIKKGLSFNLHEYWNKLLLTPGSKDRDLEWTGPFIKVLNALLSNKVIKPEQIGLTLEEKQSYSKHPILLAGWDTARYEEVAKKKADTIALFKNRSNLSFVQPKQLPTDPEKRKQELVNAIKWRGTETNRISSPNSKKPETPISKPPVLNRPPAIKKKA